VFDFEITDENVQTLGFNDLLGSDQPAPEWLY
jgi:hypothetical protein